MGIIKGSYNENDPVYLGREQYGEPKEYFKRVINLIEDIHKKDKISLIDMGCASGGFIYFAKKALNIGDCVGVDISEDHLVQARKYVKDVDFVLGSLTVPEKTIGRQFDVCTCLGVLSIFDDIEEALKILLSLVKKNGSLYIFDLINELPVDVIERHRNVLNNENADWETALNVRSMLSYKRTISKIANNTKLNWIDFKMPFPIPQTNDPLRAWTIRTEYNEHQIMVGTGQLLNFKILHILKE